MDSPVIHRCLVGILQFIQAWGGHSFGLINAESFMHPFCVSLICVKLPSLAACSEYSIPDSPFLDSPWEEYSPV